MSDFSRRKSIDSIRLRNDVAPRTAPAQMRLFQASSGTLSASTFPSFQAAEVFQENISQVLELPFGEHLKELRNRLGIFFLSIIIGSIGAYIYHEQVVALVTKPLNQSLFYSSPGGGFDFLLKLSLLTGVLISIPVFIYQFLRFLQPLFSRQSRFLIIGTVAASYLLLIAGAAFAYYVALPLAIIFLSGFATEQVQSLIMTSEYLSFLMAYLLGFGLAFQLPIILWVINFIHPFQKGQLWRAQKWVVILSFVAAALITPTPDIFNMLIMALPIILLYQISILVVWYRNRGMIN